jgi:hypothetical protein
VEGRSLRQVPALARSAARPFTLLAGLVLLLTGLDLARPYVGPSLKPGQWVAGAFTVVALGVWRRSRGEALRDALPVLALAALLVPTYVAHSRSLESDGVQYYTYLRSILFDQDLDFRNDYRLFGIEQTRPNVLPVGAPLLWSPLVLVVHLGRQAARLFGLGPPTGVEPVYQAAACFASFGYGTVGLFLLLDTLRRGTSAAAAFWATVLCWVGTPLRFYLSTLPSLAHACEFFAAVLVLRAALALRESVSLRHCAEAGLAAGLVFLVRSQDALLVALPALVLVPALRRPVQRRQGMKALAVLAGGFALGALPQIAVWQATFGVPVLVPHKAIHGAGFLHLDEPELVGTLLSPRGGLFVTHPVTLLAVLGLLLLLFTGRRPRPLFDAAYAATVLAIALATWYVNASVFDWYHVRRFTGVVPLLAPGLAHVLVPLSRIGAAGMALLAFLALRYDLAIDARRSAPGEPVPVRAALGELDDGLFRDGYSLLEPWAPRAAVRLLSSYTGDALLEDEVSDVDLGADPSVLRLPGRARYLSEPTLEDGERCRWVRERYTRLFLPLGWRGDLFVTVHARALETREPQVIEAVWNDQPAGRFEMAPEWADYRFHVPAAAVRLGTNQLVLRFERAPRFFRMRGEGPHEVRPAALGWLRLQRGR